MLRRLLQVCLARGLVAACIPPHPSPALHLVSLTCCPSPAFFTVRAPWPKIPWMEEECFGIAQCHGMRPLPGVREFRNSQETRSSNMFLEFRDSMYSVIPWKSANPISWCRLLGCRPKEKAVNQMIVQEWLPTLPSITVFTS